MTTTAHASLAGSDLHEPKGIASATSGQVYVANGSSSGAWTAQVVFSYPTLHIAGLLPTNASGDPANDITITTGTCRDIVDTVDMVLAAGLTKRLDAAWAVGDNQGGLDAGSIANTTYHLYLIKRTDTGVVDALFSTSASAPTMPASYTKKRRIGSFVRLSAAIQLFTPVETAGGGVNVLLNTIINETATGISPSTLTRVPAGIKFEAILCVTNTSATGNVGVFSPDATTVTSGTNVPANISSQAIDGAGQILARTNTSAQVKATALSGNIAIAVQGWNDFRRV